MAQRLNECPKCGKRQYTDIVVKAHNPDTTDMNMRATLRCGGPVPDGASLLWVEGSKQTEITEVEGCGHEWEGRVTSPHHERQRRRGWVI